VVVSAILFAYTLVLVLFFQEMLGRVLLDSATSGARFAVPGCMALLLAYSVSMRSLVHRIVAAGRELPSAYRWGTVAFEAAFPTIVLVLLSRVADPVFLLISPLVLSYGIFIFSATLQMDPKTPLFASLVAGAGYFGVYLMLRSAVDPAEYTDWLLLPNAYSGRVLLLILFGLLSSFLAWQTRTRVVGLMRATEEKNAIRRTFGQHVSPQVVDRLLQQKASSVSDMRHVCVMFLDIRNFTTLSENRSPEEVVAILNEIFTFMIDATNRHDGIINKFLGDGFMAVFGAPFSSGQDCVNAVATAREILERLDADNRARGRKIAVGIGLHAGKALTGDIGSVERKEYTVIGDVVNVASRIEQLNKQFDSHVLVSDAVYDQLPDGLRDGTDLGAVKVKGREAEVRLYKLA
jgi:adenylate cyclase